MQPLKSVQQAAKLLGISPWTVRSYIRNGRIKPVRLGRRVLVSEDELERLVRAGAGMKAPIDSQSPAQETAEGEVR